MANSFEKLLKPPAEEPVQEPEEAQEEEKKIEIVSEIGGRKRTPEEIEKYKRIREEVEVEVETEKKIREKLRRGELLTREEAAFLREKEITRKDKAEEKIEEMPEKEISLQDLEKNLEEKRNVYIEANKDYEKKFGEMKIEKLVPFLEKKKLAALGKKIESAREYIKAGDSEILKDEKSPQYSEAVKRKEDFIAELTKQGIKKKKAEGIYNVELKKAEYDEAKKELGKKMLAEGKKEAEIFQKLILEEREVLNKAKIESWPPKEKNLFKKGLEWWMRRGTATRLLISTGLVTGVVAMSGGFSASAIALFAGQRYLKGAGAVLVGKLVGKGADWAMEKDIRAKQEAALSELREGFSLENLKKVDKEYEKLLEEVAGKRRKKLIAKAGVMAATGAWTAIALGWLEGFAGGVKPAAVEAPSKAEAPSVETSPEVKPEVPASEVTSEAAPEAPVGAVSETEVSAPEAKVSATEAPPKAEAPVEASPEAKAPPVETAPPAEGPVAEVSGIETAKRGEGIWQLSERQLETRYGERFISLDEARKTYITDAIKDKVAVDLKKFGLEDIDKIRVGQKVDFSSIFEDKAEIDKLFERADALTDFQIKNIVHNNEVLRNWLAEHPGEELTSENVEEILTKGKVIPAEVPSEAEVPPVKAPSEAVPETPAPEAKPEAPAPEVTPEVAPKAQPEAEVPPEEVAPPMKEEFAGMNAEKVMDANEAANVKAIGLKPGEYEAIKNLKVGKLLEQILSKNEAWANWEKGKIDLPHHGTYGATEFKRHIKLTEFIRSFKPGPEVQEMTVRQFLRMVGPGGTIVM